MTLHNRIWTAQPALFECACGWRSEADEPDAASAEFDQHFSDIGYRFEDFKQTD